MAAPARPWSLEELRSEALPKREIIRFLQEQAAHGVGRGGRGCQPPGKAGRSPGISPGLRAGALWQTSQNPLCSSPAKSPGISPDWSWQHQASPPSPHAHLCFSSSSGFHHLWGGVSSAARPDWGGFELRTLDKGPCDASPHPPLQTPALAAP